jgi:hypothetical protein
VAYEKINAICPSFSWQAVRFVWVSLTVCIDLDVEDEGGPEDKERHIVEEDAVEEYLDGFIEGPENLVAAGAVSVPEPTRQVLVLENLFHRGPLIVECLGLSIITAAMVVVSMPLILVVALAMCVLMVFLNIFFAFMVDRAL